MVARLSLRPDLDQNVDGLPLYISGGLPEITPRLAYEGRLQIHNAIGRCSVEILAGSDPLPPGSTVYIDHASPQIVVAWPPYSQYVTPLENPGFETGDTSGWTFVPRGGYAVPVVDAAYRYEGARSLKWPGGRGMGSEGGIEVDAWNNTIGPCLPGQRITTRFRGMYNPAGHHFGSQYRALVRFLDSAGNPIGSPQRGQVIKGRGQNGRWNDASVSASSPAGTAGVQLGGWLTGSGAPTWMDAASWDVPSEIGVDEVGIYRIALRVRDSAGRTAIWSGVLGELTVYFTTHLYPIVVEEEPIQLQASIVGFVHKNSYLDAPDVWETAGLSAAVVGFLHKAAPSAEPIEQAILTAQVVGFIHKGTPTGEVQENTSLSASVVGFRHRSEPLADVSESANLTAQIMGFIHA